MGEQPTDDAGPHPTTTDDGDPVVGRRFARELPILILVALVAALAIRAFFFQVFSIPSVSMRPTLEPGDRVLVCEVCSLVDDLDHGDVVVFAGPGDRDYIKRIVGLPGDVVELHGGGVFVNGIQLDEPYLSPKLDPSGYGPTRVPDGMLFVLGDNRTRSGDSRFPPPRGVGLVPIDHVQGEALAVIWPPARIGAV